MANIGNEAPYAKLYKSSFLSDVSVLLIEPCATGQQDSPPQVLCCFPAHMVVLAVHSTFLQDLIEDCVHSQHSGCHVNVEDHAIGRKRLRQDSDTGAPSGSSAATAASGRELRLNVLAKDVAVVEKCFEFFYTGHVEGLNQQGIITALLFADMVNAPTLLIEATQRLAGLGKAAMEVDTATALLSVSPGLRQALCSNNPDFDQALATAHEVITREFGDFEDLSVTSARFMAFQTLPFEVLQQLLSSDETRAASENTICTAVSLWIQAESRSEEQIREISSQLRVQHCTPSYVANVLPLLPMWKYLLEGGIHHALCGALLNSEECCLTDAVGQLGPYAKLCRPLSEFHLPATMVWSIDADTVQQAVFRAIREGGKSQHLPVRPPRLFSGYAFKGLLHVYPRASAAAAAEGPDPSQPQQYSFRVGLSIMSTVKAANKAPQVACPVRLSKVEVSAGSGAHQVHTTLGSDVVSRQVFALGWPVWSRGGLFRRDPATGNPDWKSCVEGGKLTLRYTLTGPLR